MSRRPIIAGNWKMNKGIKEANELIESLKPLVKDATAECVFCPPFIDLPDAVRLTKDTNIEIGAQNMHWEEAGAFTGEIAGEMLKAIGVKFVIMAIPNAANISTKQMKRSTKRPSRRLSSV